MGVSYTKGHPAPFPEMLPERLIKLYTIEGEVFLIHLEVVEQL